MTQDDDVEPRLGKIRARGSKRGPRYLHQVLRAVALAGGIQRNSGMPRRSTFTGSRIGRGAGVGRVLASRDRYAAYRQRRVIIKSRIVKPAGKGIKGAPAHLRYIQRDGVTRDGQPGQLYSADQDRADGKAFLARSGGDRHQFRFIVSAEDGVEYDDMTPFIRRLMQQMEEDLGTGLDWVAVDHHNTGHPHSHVILRGKTDRNKDLIIAREHVTDGMRERAAEIVRLDLGPRSDVEIERRLRDEVNQERLTSIDRPPLRDQDGEPLTRLSCRGEPRYKFHFQLAFVGFGADLQGFRHARLRDLARNAQVRFMRFHKQPLREGAKGSRIHGRLNMGDGVGRK